MRDDKIPQSIELDDSQEMMLGVPELVSDTDSDTSSLDLECLSELETPSALSSPRHIPSNAWRAYQKEVLKVFDRPDAVIDELIYHTGPVLITADTTFKRGLIGYSALSVGPHVTLTFEAQALPIDNDSKKFQLHPTAKLRCKETNLKYRESIEESSVDKIERVALDMHPAISPLYHYKRKRAHSGEMDCDASISELSQQPRPVRPRLT